MIAENIEEYIQDESRILDDFGVVVNGYIVIGSVTDGESARARAFGGEAWVRMAVFSKRAQWSVNVLYQL